MKSMNISIISRLQNKSLRPYRLGFTRYLVDRYGMSSATAYPKIRSNRMKRWELVGIKGCIRQYMPGYDGELRDFYTSIKGRNRFITFMNEQMGMSRSAAIKRFRLFDFTEVEIKGFEEIYSEYKQTMMEEMI